MLDGKKIFQGNAEFKVRSTPEDIDHKATATAKELVDAFDARFVTQVSSHMSCVTFEL